MENEKITEQFTLDDITASWFGHGKKIPIGQMMAWLIREVGRFHNQIYNFSEPIRGEVSEFAEETGAKMTLESDTLKCLRSDDSGHWYVIPWDKREEFDKWIDQFDGDEPPTWATRISSPEHCVFQNFAERRDP